MRNPFKPFVITLALISPAAATAGPAAAADAEILAGWRQGDGAHMAALHISLDDGWKTYWRAPGEAGLPPQFDWSGSTNLASVDLHWPVPEIIVSNGVTTLGYKHDLILPMEVTAIDPGADIVLEGNLAMGICEEICVPLQTRVSAVLPAAVAETDPRIVSALAQSPDSAAEAGVTSVECGVEEIADGLRVTARIEMPAVGPDEYLVVESADRSIWVSEAMVQRVGNVLAAEADLVPPESRPFDLDPETLGFTVLAQGRGVEIKGCAAAK